MAYRRSAGASRGYRRTARRTYRKPTPRRSYSAGRARRSSGAGRTIRIEVVAAPGNQLARPGTPVSLAEKVAPTPRKKPKL